MRGCIPWTLVTTRWQECRKVGNAKFWVTENHRKKRYPIVTAPAQPHITTANPRHRPCSFASVYLVEPCLWTVFTHTETNAYQIKPRANAHFFIFMPSLLLQFFIFRKTFIFFAGPWWSNRKRAFVMIQGTAVVFVEGGVERGCMPLPIWPRRYSSSFWTHFEQSGEKSF